MKHNLVCGALTLGLSALPMTGQWLNYPTPGIPRTADGKPNLSAPAPKDRRRQARPHGPVERVRRRRRSQAR